MLSAIFYVLNELIFNWDASRWLAMFLRGRFFLVVRKMKIIWCDEVCACEVNDVLMAFIQLAWHVLYANLMLMMQRLTVSLTSQLAVSFYVMLLLRRTLYCMSRRVCVCVCLSLSVSDSLCVCLCLYHFLCAWSLVCDVDWVVYLVSWPALLSCEMFWQFSVHWVSKYLTRMEVFWLIMFLRGMLFLVYGRKKSFALAGVSVCYLALFVIYGRLSCVSLYSGLTVSRISPLAVSLHEVCVSISLWFI